MKLLEFCKFWFDICYFPKSLYRKFEEIQTDSVYRVKLTCLNPVQVEI